MRGVAVLLTLSTQWAGGGIETHYGRLPIGFLPFSSERFLHAQRRIAPAWPCVVTIPEEFQLSAREQQEFQSDGLQFLAQPASFRWVRASLMRYGAALRGGLSRSCSVSTSSRTPPSGTSTPKAG